MTLIGSGGCNINTNGNSVTFSGALSGTGGLNIYGGGNLTSLTLGGSNTYTRRHASFGHQRHSRSCCPTPTRCRTARVTLSSSSNALLFNTQQRRIPDVLRGRTSRQRRRHSCRHQNGFPATLSVGGNGASTTYSGALSGSGGLTKTGSGILDLCGTNTYTGATTITAGTLKLDFSQPGAPATNIINNRAMPRP